MGVSQFRWYVGVPQSHWCVGVFQSRLCVCLSLVSMWACLRFFALWACLSLLAMWTGMCQSGPLVSHSWCLYFATFFIITIIFMSIFTIVYKQHPLRRVPLFIQNGHRHSVSGLTCLEPTLDFVVKGSCSCY